MDDQGVVCAMVADVMLNIDGTKAISPNGNYTTDEFVAIMNRSYTLEVVYENEVYLATETMTPVTNITDVPEAIKAFLSDF